jgi:hypothetical protein
MVCVIGSTTVTVQVAVRLPSRVVTVITALPVAAARTVADRPSPLIYAIDAMEGALLDQATFLSVA